MLHKNVLPIYNNYSNIGPTIASSVKKPRNKNYKLPKANNKSIFILPTSYAEI